MSVLVHSCAKFTVICRVKRVLRRLRRRFWDVNPGLMRQAGILTTILRARNAATANPGSICTAVYYIYYRLGSKFSNKVNYKVNTRTYILH